MILLLLLLVGCGNDDDGMVVQAFSQLNISDVSKFEGNTNTTFDFSVRLSKPVAETVTVDVQTHNGSALSGEDYVELFETLQFQPGETELTVVVEVLADTLKEGDDEFEVRLSNPDNAVIIDGSATGTIRNDDTYQPGGSGDGYSTPESYPGYTLVWQDEFEGNAINANNWKHELGNHGWGNNEWQNYTANPENSYLSDGKLVIEARNESSGGSNYSSARMITAGLQEFQYGRVDIRAKLPEGQGIWPALWMLGSNFFDSGWPSCGEIDIMELLGHQPSTSHGTVHWENNGTHASYSGSTTLEEGKYSDEFHVFTIIWDEQKIRWLVDDQQFHVIDITPPELSEFHQPFFFLFNIAVGGNWPGYPDQTTVFPQRMYVDYIRVFQ